MKRFYYQSLLYSSLAFWALFIVYYMSSSLFHGQLIDTEASEMPDGFFRNLLMLAMPVSVFSAILLLVFTVVHCRKEGLKKGFLGLNCLVASMVGAIFFNAFNVLNWVLG